MTFWNGDTWRALPKDKAPVTPFDPDCVEFANYLMSIGDEVYVSTSDQKDTIRALKDGESFTIRPGQFAYILTKEHVRIPMNAIGFISIRASIKFAGLVNISGFHVDPGYDGKLLFSVFNAGPSNIHLKKGQRLFPLWIASLDKANEIEKEKKGHTELDPKLITDISGNYTTAFEVKNDFDKLRSEYNATKIEVMELKLYKMQAITIFGIIVIIFGLFTGWANLDRLTRLVRWEWPPTPPSSVTLPETQNTLPRIPQK
ncbi:MAG: hypothetical protein J0H01_23075 [Rhizobiales bacterium]|nr:hypothetical protein [Hyphomicrobiales bacterium]